MNRERFGRRTRLVAAKQGADLRAGQGLDDGAGQTPESGPADTSRRRFPLAIWRRTPLRARLALAATIAVAAGVGGGVGFAYVAVRHSLTQQVDDTLMKQGIRMQLQQMRPRTGSTRTDKIPQIDATPQVGEPRLNFQYINDKGLALVPWSPTRSTPASVAAPVSFPALARPLPVTPQDVRVAAGTLSSYIHSTQWNGQHVRILTLPIPQGHAMQIENPLTTMDGQLSTLGWQLFGAGVAGIVLAAGLGWLVTRTALRPVAELTSTAERIAATHDLAHRIAIDGTPGEPHDELGRLAATFNSMLDAVQEATDRQRQLVADASHELRTPLTSLRTNVEVLAHAHRLEPEDREALVSGIMSGLDDLTMLVSDTVELARGEEQAALFEELRFDLLVQRCVDRATTHWPKVVFKEQLDESVVVGVTDRLAKAVRNLLDNAAKFSPEGGLIEVGTTAGADGTATLTVRDHGPGIPEADLPHVFDRFYRAASARGLPGSGLGLAIVTQVAVGHGGRVTVVGAEGGGAEFRLTLPLAPRS